MDMEDLRRACPAAFYRPNTAAPEELIELYGGKPGSKSHGDAPFFESDASRRLSIGGNRSAKSTKLVLESGATILGVRPWYDPDSPWFMRGLPKLEGRDKRVRVRFVVTNFETQIQEVMDEFRKWWPKSWWKIASKNQKGHPTQLDWFPRDDGDCTGSVFFMSHNQDTEDFEGIESDLVVWNEPPPHDKWTALHRGLVSSGGRSITGATPLTKSDWFWDEVILPYEDGSNPEYSITYHSIWDNTAENGGYERQKAEAVSIWLEEIKNPDERLAREHGAPMQLAGRVLSGFRPGEHLIDPFELPYDSAIIGCIDPAGTRPMAGLHIAYVENKDPGPEWIGFVFDETYIRGLRSDLSEFARIWNEKEDGSDEYGPFHPRRSDKVLIDPFSEGTEKGDTLGRSMRDILREDYGIHTTKVNRANKNARLTNLNARIIKGHYQFFRGCTPRLMDEIPKWQWDASSSKLTSGIDDVCDCLSYIDNTNPFHFIPTEQNIKAAIYRPGESTEEPRWDEVRKMRDKEKWRYLIYHGMKPTS